MINAYPLTWPPMIPRYMKRERGRFETTLSKALSNVTGSLQRFGNDSGKPITDIVLSSNVTLGVHHPADPGVAVWFKWEGEQICIPVDRYSSPEANLQAIYSIIEARRVELRHGTLALVRATFQGFKALPAPAGSRSWREVLGFDQTATVTTEDARASYRKLSSANHPDKGGTHAQMAEVNAAYEQAKQELA